MNPLDAAVLAVGVFYLLLFGAIALDERGYERGRREAQEEQDRELLLELDRVREEVGE